MVHYKKKKLSLHCKSETEKKHKKGNIKVKLENSRFFGLIYFINLQLFKI